MKGNVILTAVIALSVIFSCKKPGGGNEPDPSPDNTPAPVITGFNPNHGVTGAVVAISGRNFHTDKSKNEVKFNNVAAVVNNATATQLDVVIPVAATTGRVSVKVGEKSGTSVTDFIIDPAGPEITDFTPKSGPMGTEVTVTGKLFGANPIVWINNIRATVKESSATQIKFLIPAATNLTKHKFTITIGAAVMNSKEDFIITSEGKMAEWKLQTVAGLETTSIFFGGTSFVYNKKIYWGFTRMMDVFTEVEYKVYDPAKHADGWVTKRLPATVTIPSDITFASSMVYRNKVYFGTGLSGAGPASSMISKWWQLDLENNNALPMTDFPVATHQMTSFVYKDNLYAGFGGGNKKLFKFNPAGQGSWTELIANAGFAEMSAAGAMVFNDQVILGRAIAENLGSRKSIYKFTEPGTLVRLDDMPDLMPAMTTPSFTLPNGKGYFVIDNQVWEFTPAISGGTWRKVEEHSGAMAIQHVAVIDDVVYGWTGTGRLFKFEFLP